jgi:hypothetical protein
MKSGLVHGLALLGVTAAGALSLMDAAGCGVSVSAVCDAICDCERCSNDEYDDCVDDTEDAFRKAERQGCSAKTDAYLSCVDASLQCVDERVRVSSCDLEYDELVACAKSAPRFGGSCDEGAARLQECLGITVDPSERESCTGSVRCTLSCYAGASCQELQSGSSPELTMCLSSCPGNQPPPPER